MRRARKKRRGAIVLRLVLPAVAVACVALAPCPAAFALDPALDVSQYAHTAWKIREGLFRGEIHAFAQTPDGYLWLGTEFGLIRFDGVRPEPWQPPRNQPLPSNFVMSLLAARDGTLLIGTDQGLARWKDGKLTQYSELAGQFIYALLQDHEGTLWVGSGGPEDVGRLCVIRSDSLQCYGRDGIFGQAVYGLYEDSKGNLWAGVRNGLWRWKPGPPRFFSVPNPPDGIQGFSEGDDGALLIGTRRGIRRLIDGKIGPYPQPSSVPLFDARKLFRDRNGGLWVGTQAQGLVHVHQGRVDVFSSSDGLSGQNVYSLFEDREGTIWVATINGVDRFRDFAAATFSVNQGLSKAQVWSVLADRDGRVWLSSTDGLSRWNSGQINTYGTSAGKQDGKINGLPPNSLFQDRRGRIWVSTFRQFGYLQDERFVPIATVPGGQLLSIAQDNAGNLWVVNEHVGLFRFSTRGDVQRISWVDLGHKDHASVLAADRSRGGVWIGFYLGGISYFNDGQIRESYAPADGLGEGRVGGFHFDQKGTLWIATVGGLSRLKNGRVVTLNSKNGLPCDTVHWAMEDDAHSFWLYTSCGLVRIDGPELDLWEAAVDKDKYTSQKIQATVFDSSDGVRTIRMGGHYSPLAAKTPDGRIWFLPWDGVSIIDPLHLPYNKVPPPVHVEKITADGKTYDATSYEKGGLPLPAHVRDLTIDYTALSLAVPEKVHFRFKLEGQDSDWREVVNKREVGYSNLEPRKYRFRVTACNNSGVWNEEGASLDFSIAPAYYQTNWFRALCVAAFVALLWALYELRLRGIQRQFNVGLEERLKERTRIARELHDTLLQNLHGLLFRFQAARNMLPRRPEEAMEALDGAISRTEQAITESQDAITDLRPGSDTESDLGELVRAAGKELETAASGNGAPPGFSVIVEGERKALSPILKAEVYRIVHELLRNSFRHAGARQIEAEVRYGDEQLRVRIRDDGKGMDPEVLKKGRRSGHWGILGVKERAEQIGAKLDFWSEPGAGTEVQLSIPAAIAYKNSHGRPRFKFLRKVKVDD